MANDADRDVGLEADIHDRGCPSALTPDQEGVVVERSELEGLVDERHDLRQDRVRRLSARRERP
jgi:hypothetical protein